MDAEKILQLLDELIFSHTGKHLDDLQQEILLGSIEGKKYPEIATQVHREAKYVKDTGAKLWKLISDVLGEKVSKFNVRSTLKKLDYSNISTITQKTPPFKGGDGGDCPPFLHINSVNVCQDPQTPSKNLTSLDGKNTRKTKAQLQEDLRDAPQQLTFFGRTEELTFLATNIIEKKARLVGLFGVSGIGKTALTLELVNQIKHNFDYIIWRSLRHLPSLREIQTDIIKLITQTPAQTPEITISDSQLCAQVKSYLHQHRCLIILDEVQLIFSKGKPAGTYLPGYENYGDFLKIIAEIPHNSCLLFTSWEKPREIDLYNQQYCCSLPLTGLGKHGEEVIKAQGNFGSKLDSKDLKKLEKLEKLDKLIEFYEANPLYLKIVAGIINNLFAGKIEELLTYEQPFLDNDLQWILQQQLERLSPSEINLLQILAQQNNSVSLSSLSAVEVSAVEVSAVEVSAVEVSAASPLGEVSDSSTSVTDRQIINDIQSLKRRYLIKTEEKENQTRFYLDKVLQKYLKTVG